MNGVVKGWMADKPWVLAEPFRTMFPAEMGAEVIKAKGRARTTIANTTLTLVVVDGMLHQSGFAEHLMLMRS